MPAATFLHIQGGDQSPTRVLELPAGPVRVGRGPLCEVRLAGPDLGDVQCLLRRRGNTWHYQPVGPPGRVWIDGRPADAQRPIPVGVPLRVGDHWLTLRAAEGSAEPWGSFNAPIPVEPRPADPGPPAPGPPGPPDDGTGPAPAGAADGRLQRWQSRVEQREQWLKDRQDEKRWEARWKAAGETIRARSAAPTTPPSRPPTPNPSPAARPAQAPPAARPVEPRPAPSFRRIAEPAPRPTPVRVPLRTTPPPAEPPARVEPAAPASRALVALPPPPVDWSGARIAPAEVPAEPEVSPPTIEPVQGPAVEAGVAPDPGPTGVFDEAPVVEAVVAIEPDAAVPEATVAIEIEAGPGPAILDEAPGPPELAAWAEPTPTPTPRVAEPSAAEAPARVSRPGPSTADWPSARSIFAAQGVRPTGLAAEPARAGRRGRPAASPTDVRGPACWSIPTWLGWLPAAATSLALGLVGVGLASAWTLDGLSADRAMALALRPEGEAARPIDPADLPRGGWWRSTAPHLAAWAVALARAEGEDHAEDIRGLLEGARRASALGATTRFAIEPVARPEEGDPSPDLAHLGRTRDAVTLAWAGRRLREAGKVDASLRAYRSALAIAARARADRLDPPAFDEDNQVRRYRLPREASIGPVVLGMSRAGDWSPEQWAEALPESATAPWVASRLLRKAGKPAEADRLVDLAIARADAPTAPGLDPAEHHAAVAEAMAHRGRWADAAGRYGLAIERAVDDPTRRRYWLNLAEVAYHVGDDAARARAFESAKAPDAADEITRKALLLQQGNPGLANRGRDRP